MQSTSQRVTRALIIKLVRDGGSTAYCNCSKMPPKNQVSQDSLKQKSLMAWLSKDQAKPTKTQSASKNVDSARKQTKLASIGQSLPPSSSPGSVKSIEIDHEEDAMPRSATLEVSGGTPSREGSTPPTSDAIDVDMLRIDDDEDQDDIGNASLSTRRVLYFGRVYALN